MPVVNIPTARINDWDSFHDVFAEVLGFLDRYGRNMNAWIDCMTDADEPQTQMMKVSAGAGDVLTLHLEDVKDFRKRCPELFDAIVDESAFVNYRRIEMGRRPIIALSFHE